MNLYRAFRDLIPEPPLLVGVVTSLIGTGAVQVTLPDSGVISARGAASIGATVFVRDGVIEGIAPSLSTSIIEI